MRLFEYSKSYDNDDDQVLCIHNDSNFESIVLSSIHDEKVKEDLLDTGDMILKTHRATIGKLSNETIKFCMYSVSEYRRAQL